MRDQKRIKRILKKLEKLWKKNPDMRLGQLLINFARFEDIFPIWSQEDDITEKLLDDKLK